ncbi:type II toxin-antitoxin system VapC family toxin [Nitrosococcus oceani]|uniref:type II toxin-antitoxin system VapC family toxin n=1 Tax=Nitrosococcus oceani TaxID=1229 RepID=UPI0004E8C468|nr:type II toxin-antitoxin system VapC family toxin [Nitrosococcus oceani]KFI21747.1 twitching motility protein PilT [Nitrosococcus oceani]
MIAVDTNVWVRYVTNDDEIQAQQAMALLGSNEILVTKTVLLELGWVLEAVYDLPSEVVLRAMRHILGLPNVRVEAPGEVSLALNLYGKGLDFADAMHLASAGAASVFYTFDGKFSRSARAHGYPVIPVAEAGPAKE